MLFKSLRIKLWMNSIRDAAYPYLPLALEKEILAHEPQRISQLAHIAKSVNHKDTKDRIIFKISLTLFVKNPGLIDYSMKDSVEIRDLLNELLQKHARAFAEKVKNDLSPRMPDGCSIAEAAAQQTAVELLLADTDDGGVYSGLILAIKKNRAKYIEGYTDWLNNTSTTIFDAIRVKLQEEVPNGCSINAPACTKELTNLLSNVDIIENDISYDEVVSELYKRISRDPERFFLGLDDILKEAAKVIFNQINSQLSESFPSGVTLDETSCIRLIRALIKEGGEPSALVEKFMNALKNNHEEYVLINGMKKERFRSFQGYSSGKDQAMLAREY